MEAPTLIINELLLEAINGGVALRGPARFANVKVASDNDPILVSQTASFPKLTNGQILSYKVSDPMNYSTSKNDISAAGNWKRIKVGSTGVANLAMLHPRTNELDAVVAQATIVSNSKVQKTLEFGFSDGVTVFLNGRPIFSGENTFRSRDYRYLGTIGYFHSLHLDLKKGKNTLSFLVRENFGGWGVQANFNDLNGIRLE